MGLGAIGGLISGAEGKKTRTESTIEVADASEFEKMLRSEQESLFKEISDLNKASGLGAEDVQKAVGAQRSVADLLLEMQQSGGLPGAQDIAQSQDVIGKLFAPQREQLAQSFEQQMIGANRDAARMGRDLNDPILRNKLAQEQTRQTRFLDTQQGAAGTQLALSLPGQRLNFAGARADVLGNLANQAFSNRASLLATGNQLSEQERNFRFNTAKRTNTNITPGSLGGALTGAAAGLASDVKTAASVVGMVSGGVFGGGGGGGGGPSSEMPFPGVSQSGMYTSTPLTYDVNNINAGVGMLGGGGNRSIASVYNLR